MAKTTASTIAPATDEESSDEANDSSNVSNNGISCSTIRSTLNDSVDGDNGARLSGHQPNDAAKPIDLVSTPSKPSVPPTSAPIGDSASSISGSSMGRVPDTLVHQLDMSGAEAFDVVGARGLVEDDGSNSKDHYDSTNKSNRNLVYPPISPASTLEGGRVSIVEGDGMGSGSNGTQCLASTLGPVHDTPTKLIPYCSTSSPAMSSNLERLASEPCSSFLEASMGSDCGGTLLPRRQEAPDDNFSNFLASDSTPNSGKPHPSVTESQPNSCTVQQHKRRLRKGSKRQAQRSKGKASRTSKSRKEKNEARNGVDPSHDDTKASRDERRHPTK